MANAHNKEETIKTMTTICQRFLKKLGESSISWIPVNLSMPDPTSRDSDSRYPCCRQNSGPCSVDTNRSLCLRSVAGYTEARFSDSHSYPIGLRSALICNEAGHTFRPGVHSLRHKHHFGYGDGALRRLA